MYRTVLASACLSLLPVLAAAQPLDPWRPSAPADPLRAAFPQLDAATAATPAAGEWRLVLDTAYFNLWGAADGVAAVRDARGLRREPVTPEQLREAETFFPDDRLWLADLEGVSTRLSLARGLGRGWTATLTVPWLEIGRPAWDGVAERWHEVTGLPDADRDLFPRGASLLYLRGSGDTLERLDLGGGGLGDVSLALSAPLGRRFGAEHRAVVSLQAPTGDDATLRGSGSWDAAVQWLAVWRRETFAAIAGAGLSRNRGRLLGVAAADGWQLLAGADGRLWGRLHGTFRAQLERAPLAALAAGDATEPALCLRFGIAAPLVGARWLAFELGQDWPGIGLAPDFSFHLAWGGRLGG